MGVVFTPDQQRVIDTRNCNILVSAAAGSGKTAVLVERIIQKICDKEHPTDIDRLLIVTFTSAAAAQMRERISDAVMKRLEAEPENEHLQKQSALIHNAQITTIDSFCLFVIRNNFNAIDLDPGFRVADEAELKLVKKDVLDKLLEEKFAEADPSFLHFVECYSTGLGEQKIEDAINRLYHFSISFAFPEEWLVQRKEDYLLESQEQITQKEWFRQFLVYLQAMLTECREKIKHALTLAMEPDGPDQYIENLEDDLRLIEGLTKYDTYEKLYTAFQAVKFTTLSRKKGTDVAPDRKEMVQGMRNEVKSMINDLTKNFFQMSPEVMLADMQACQPVVNELVSLTLQYKERLDAAKREKNVIDFSDMEHFALQILLKKDENGNLVETETAKELQAYFEEVMIDEYQDSNDVQELLLKSVSGESDGHYNRFMVGDVKQSIYKFRLARPEIFMNKYEEYERCQEVGKQIRIDLSKNFRSRREITDATNYICGQIMSKSIGNVDYDEKAVLNVGATYYPQAPEEDRFCTELLLAVPGEEESKDSKELEAHMVAQKILDLKKNFQVTDAQTGELRPAKFGDIVLLFRATTGWDEEFRKVLATYHIPVHITSKTGYFETMEIQGMVNLLKILDNPMQDIAFFGFLKMPFLHFSEVEIAKVKAIYKQDRKEEKKKVSLYEQFIHVSKLLKHTKNEPELQAKMETMFDFIKRYREKVAYTPIKELIQEILKETGYAAYTGSMPDGEQRQANMELLLEKAGAFEKTSFYGLFHFIRYLETIKEQDVDFGEANILDENADVVRIMTIHKSKGLEFPICFVCGLSKQFNQMDMRQSIIMDVDAGIGVDCIDPVLRVKKKTLRKNVVACRMKEDTRGEDLRVFYVAMTRAKEKLFLTGYQKDVSKYLRDNMQILMDGSQKLPYSVLMNAGSYMDLVILSLMRHKSMRKLLQEADIPVDMTYGLVYQEIAMKVVVWQYEDSMEQEVIELGKSAMLEEQLSQTGALKDDELAKELEKRLENTYAHMNLEGMTVKTTVSELKKSAYEEENEPVDVMYPLEKQVYVPTFIHEKEVQGVKYGTAVHKVLELLSYREEYASADSKKMLAQLVEEEMQQWIAEQIVDEEDISCVKPYKIAAFLESSLAKRMVRAKRIGMLFREQPFVMGISADRLNEKFPPSETVLIQGVIDVFFEEDGEIVLADYKTDRVKAPEELVKRYASQLAYYEQALTGLTGKKVKEKIIYSFALEKEIYV